MAPLSHLRMSAGMHGRAVAEQRPAFPQGEPEIKESEKEANRLYFFAKNKQKENLWQTHY